MSSCLWSGSIAEDVQTEHCPLTPMPRPSRSLWGGCSDSSGPTSCSWLTDSRTHLHPLAAVSSGTVSLGWQETLVRTSTLTKGQMNKWNLTGVKMLKKSSTRALQPGDRQTQIQNPWWELAKDIYSSRTCGLTSGRCALPQGGDSKDTNLLMS